MILKKLHCNHFYTRGGFKCYLEEKIKILGSELEIETEKLWIY